MAVIKPQPNDPMNTTKMEVYLARHFCYRTNLIVPNVWWGIGLSHECDLLIVTKSGYATEIEIKVTNADFKRDLQKRHCHGSNKIRRFYFAFPNSLNIDEALIDKNAGIIRVFPRGRCEITRASIGNKMARPLSSMEIDHLYRLGCMRIWSLKEGVLSLKERLLHNSRRTDGICTNR